MKNKKAILNYFIDLNRFLSIFLSFFAKNNKNLNGKKAAVKEYFKKKPTFTIH